MTGAYIRPSWLTGWKTDRKMYSSSRMTPPPRNAVTTVYVVTGMTLNFANNSQQSKPYVPIVSSTMCCSPWSACGSANFGVQYSGRLELFLQTVETPLEIGRVAGSGKRSHLPLRRLLLLVGFGVHHRPDVSKLPEGVQSEQAEPARHVDRLRVRMVPLLGDLVWQVVNVNERVERQCESDDQDHQRKVVKEHR